MIAVDQGWATVGISVLVLRSSSDRIEDPYKRTGLGKYGWGFIALCSETTFNYPSIDGEI